MFAAPNGLAIGERLQCCYSMGPSVPNGSETIPKEHQNSEGRKNLAIREGDFSNRAMLLRASSIVLSVTVMIWEAKFSVND
jgi:hypothetical protein